MHSPPSHRVVSRTMNLISETLIYVVGSTIHMRGGLRIYL